MALETLALDKAVQNFDQHAFRMFRFLIRLKMSVLSIQQALNGFFKIYDRLYLVLF